MLPRRRCSGQSLCSSSGRAVLPRAQQAVPDAAAANAAAASSSGAAAASASTPPGSSRSLSYTSYEGNTFWVKFSNGAWRGGEGQDRGGSRALGGWTPWLEGVFLPMFDHLATL